MDVDQSKNKITLLVVSAIILIAGASFIAWSKLSNQPKTAPCTQEAKLCPDGSYVSRSEPNCEFAQCPDGSSNLWKTITDSKTGITFKYPEKLLTNYIFTQSWPPKVAVSDKKYELDCPETPAESSLPNRVAKRLVDNRTYCVKASSEGAAGTVYTTYNYSTIKENKLVDISFVLAYPQCDNYGEPERSQCRNERETFDLDSVVDRIAQSVTLTGSAKPSPKPTQSNRGTITGTVLLGPTCPVMKNPPDPRCADRPYKTTIRIQPINPSAPYTSVSTDASGNYNISLDPGTYTLMPIGGNSMLPTCRPEQVTIVAGQAQKVPLYCDTGIR